MLSKICGLTRQEDVDEAARLGMDCVIYMLSLIHI